MTTLKRLAVAAALTTYALIVLGAWVRATDSGLSCPDWPTCWGFWVPTPGRIESLGNIGYTYGQVMLEWVHRFVAGIILGPMILVLGVLAWRARGEDRSLPWLGTALILLLLFQGALGGFTVLDQNSPWSVALHLGTALVILSLILLVFERAQAWPRPAPERGVLPLAALVWLLALGAMVSAAMTAKSGASLACATWPLCDGALIPDLSHPAVQLHFSHRALAAATGIGIVALAVLARRERPLAIAAMILVALQIGLGGLVIVLMIPTWAAVLHQALGVSIFVLITLLMWRSVCGRATRRLDVHARGTRDGRLLGA